MENFNSYWNSKEKARQELIGTIFPDPAGFDAWWKLKRPEAESMFVSLTGNLSIAGTIKPVGFEVQKLASLSVEEAANLMAQPMLTTFTPATVNELYEINKTKLENLQPILNKVGMKGGKFVWDKSMTLQEMGLYNTSARRVKKYTENELTLRLMKLALLNKADENVMKILAERIHW